MSSLYEVRHRPSHDLTQYKSMDRPVLPANLGPGMSARG